MSRLDNRKAALERPCPSCGALPGSPCTGRRGGRAAPHKERYKGVSLAPKPRSTSRVPEDIVEKTLRLIADDYLAIIRISNVDDPPSTVESPIEMAMYLAFVHEATAGYRRLEVAWGSDWENCEYNDLGTLPGSGAPSGRVYAQCKVGPYRADFLVCIRHEWEGHKLDRLVAVECDGHDFHHATKAQVERDKARDRHFATKGILLMRFPGSEIYRNAVSCVNQVAEAVENMKEHWHSQATDIEFARWRDNQ
jgi:very-short-patch-repair endonuclease